MSSSHDSGHNYEIRPATADEMAALMQVAAYAFANNQTPEQSPPPPLFPEWSLAAFAGEQIVASSGGFPFQLLMNGRTMAADGVTLVATDPGHRRRGIVRRLITQLMERAHANDVPVSILWASMGAIYQRFGYGLASTAVSYTVEPRHVQFQFGAPAAGHTRLLEHAAALPLCKQIYRQYISQRTLMVKRAQLFWDLMLRRQHDQNMHTAVYFDAAGEPAAYALYRTQFLPTDNFADQQIMHIEDTGWTTIEGYRGIWEFLASHDLVSRINHLRAAEDDPGPHLLLNPRMLHRRTRDGIWLRVVNIAGALQRRGYQRAGSTVIGLREDPECPWNIGNWRLTTDGNETRVERTGATPDVDVSLQGLASLVSGHCSASLLHDMGRLNANDPAQLGALDGLFATRHRPALLNMF